MSFFNTLLPSFNGGCAEAETRATRRPRYDITETAEGYDVAVNLPGVAKDGLEITDEGGELRITGKPAFTLPEGRRSSAARRPTPRSSSCSPTTTRSSRRRPRRTSRTACST